MKLQDFEQRSISLLTSRGILPAKHDAADRFANDFIAYGWLFHSKYNTGKEMLEMLEDDDNLNPGDCFNINFSGNLKDLVVDKLIKNTTFSDLLNVLVNNKAKGVGVGELILPLLISHWRFSNESDGLYRGEKKELKRDGASLKPVTTKETKKGLIDQLNAKYFNGLKPGNKSSQPAHSKYIKGLSKDKQLSVYKSYFAELYPGNNTDAMAEQLLENIDNLSAYNTILGKNVMKWYREVDGWTSIVIIDPDTLDIVNIADIESVNTEENIQLSFRPVMSRGSDTQAVPDGYVNVSIAKPKTAGNRYFDLFFEQRVSPEQIVAEQKEKQLLIEADQKFVTFLTDPSDPLTQAWRQIGTEDKVEARDFIIDMLKDGVANAVIATTVVKSFC